MNEWRINFFDLGSFTGEETALFLSQMEGLRVGRKVPVICAYLFEANRAYADYCTKRFADDARVFVSHAAVGVQNGTCQLYVGKTPEACSLYEDKHDVGKGLSFTVPEIALSDWLRDRCLDARAATAINIIKANIEGAEWDLIADLDDAGMFGLFDIFLGSDQWVADMRKCHSLLGNVPKAVDVLGRNGVTVLPFCCGTDNYPNQPPCTDLAVECRRIMEARSLVEA